MFVPPYQRTILPDEYKQLSSCINSKKNLGYYIFGVILGGSGMKYAIDINGISMSRVAYLGLIYAGSMMGYTISKVYCMQACLKTIQMTRADPEILPIDMYERKKNKEDDKELNVTDVPSTTKRESIFEMESVPQMNMFDDSPITNENANVDIPEKKTPVVPQRNVTYEELRQRNREMFESKFMLSKPAKFHNPPKEQSKPVKRPETESMESKDIVNDLGTGRHRTKYGDIWD